MTMGICRWYWLTALALTFSFTAGFQLQCPLSTTIRASKDTVLSLQASLHDNNNNNEHEISRRTALIASTATAAVAFGGTPPEVLAETVVLALTLSSLETDYADSVNTKGAPEKHLPLVSVTGRSVQVVVPHVMDEEKPHFIEYIWLKDIDSNVIVASKAFAATDKSPPTLTSYIPKKTEGATTLLKPLLFCNLHGLWEGETFAV